MLCWMLVLLVVAVVEGREGSQYYDGHNVEPPPYGDGEESTKPESPRVRRYEPETVLFDPDDEDQVKGALNQIFAGRRFDEPLSPEDFTSFFDAEYNASLAPITRINDALTLLQNWHQTTNPYNSANKISKQMFKDIYRNATELYQFFTQQPLNELEYNAVDNIMPQTRAYRVEQLMPSRTQHPEEFRSTFPIRGRDELLRQGDSPPPTPTTATWTTEREDTETNETTDETSTSTTPETTVLTTTTTIHDENITTEDICKAWKPTTPATTTTTTTKKTTLHFDIEKFLEIVANLTYDYYTNLTAQVNETLRKMSMMPTCPTLSPPPTEFDYMLFNDSMRGKCFVCGMENTGIPLDADCADAFAGDFIPLVPQNPKAKGQIAHFRKYCAFRDVNNFVINKTMPRMMWGRWTGGCSVRWTDLSGVYTQRTCRSKYKAAVGKHYASKRMAKLEMALSHTDNGCIISPVATLLPLSRGISLFARFHACVCTGSWCNGVTPGVGGVLPGGVGGWLVAVVTMVVLVK